MSRLLTHLLPGGGTVQAGAAPAQADPFESGMWPLHRADFLDDPENWRNDAGVVVLGPEAAEDAMHVPFTLDATALKDVARIVVTIDYSPIPQALTFWPGRALALLGFAVKYESGSPLRASVALDDGSWRMGAHFVSAMGGGCTAPAATHGRQDWQEGFGEIRARFWGDSGRLRVWLRHPQDTGLAPGIAAHHLTEMVLSDDSGEITRIDLHEPIEENPALTFLLPPDITGPVTIRARDNIGYDFTGEVAA